jgi:hypothetical protein
VSEAFHAGPLRVRIETAEPSVREKLAETLALYDGTWEGPFDDVVLEARAVPGSATMVDGAYLRCARMSVNATAGEVHATTRCGAQMRSRGEQRQHWAIEVPETVVASAQLEELEDLVGLALTAGWRYAGWVPVHAAALVRGGICPIVCAGSGGGKSTITAALVRTGWRTLGDDKLLLRCDAQGPELRALLHTFNLHPRTREWFPEVGDLTLLPPYSSWTEKRKFRVDRTWPKTTAPHARPTHVVRMRRSSATRGIAVSELARAEIFPTLLKQIAIPSDRAEAAPILSTVARAVGSLRGLDIVVGDDAYRDGDCLSELERALER